MKRLAIALALVIVLVASAPPARATMSSPGEEIGLSLAAAFTNLFYVPAKTVFAVSGLVAGAFVGVLTGGDERAAYAIWVPAATGTFFVRPSNLDASEPLEFVGSDYADRPTPRGAGMAIVQSYEDQYSTR